MLDFGVTITVRGNMKYEIIFTIIDTILSIINTHTHIYYWLDSGDRRQLQISVCL